MHDFLKPDRPGHLWRKVKRFIDPSEMEAALLARGEANPRAVSRGVQVQRSGDAVRAMQLIRSGAFLESRVTRDGRRQIQRVLFPGDVIGSHDAALRTHTADVYAVADSEITEVSRDTLPDKEVVRISRLFYALRMVDQAILADRIQAVARADGETRLLYFLLELNARQRLTCPMIGNAVWVPLTQSDLGDALGLTNVYISKLFGSLRRRGTLRLRDDMIDLVDRERLVEQIGFEERYDAIDPAWLETGFQGNVPASELTAEAAVIAAE